MTKWVGRRGALGFAKEASRAVAVAPTYWLPYESLDFDDKVEKQIQQSAFGTIADSDANYNVNKYAEGSFTAHLEDKAIGLILSNVIGTAPTSAGSTNYTHTYPYTNTNQHQSLSIGLKTPNENKIMPLAMIEEFKITVEPNGFAMVECSVMSRGGKDWATLTPAYNALGNKFLHQHLSFKVASNVAGLATASALSLKSLTFTIKKNVLKEYVAGTLAPEDLLNQDMAVTGEFTLVNDDTVWRNYFLDGSYKAIEIRFTYGASNYLYFQLPYCSFNSWELDGGLSDIKNQKLEFIAHYDAANAQGQIHTAVLANQVSSY